MIKIGVIGCTGRMGDLVVDHILSRTDCQFSAGLVSCNSELIGQDIGIIKKNKPTGVILTDHPTEVVKASDVIIDFSQPEVSMKILAAAEPFHKPYVLATTGFSDDQKNTIQHHAQSMPLVLTPNTSLGMNALFHLIEQLASILPEEYEVEIMEMHHRNKIDAPSGTAIKLGEHIAKARGLDFEKIACTNRSGVTETRPRNQIGFATLRGGNVMGDHHVIFIHDDEKIQISHQALDRKMFAAGAVKAALWVAHKPSGLYSMKDVLGLL